MNIKSIYGFADQLLELLAIVKSIIGSLERYILILRKISCSSTILDTQKQA